ncbi:hypothetical protein C8J57DRAFT_1223989 [Mycena rebaudengoi]|nr:hypothetical protein C8J57DRAFT_1223989 [Mycena rebaudengoi]
MTGMKFLQLLFLFAWMSGVSMSQSQNVCSPTTGLCFEQFFVSNCTLQDPVLNVTVGFALPGGENSNFPDELIVLGGGNIFERTKLHILMTAQSFPLPYGFSGLSFDDTLPMPTWYVIFTSAAEAESTPFSLDKCRAEMVTNVSNEMLTPVLDSPAVWTFSPLTTWWAGESAQFIFRCQNCSELTNRFRGGELKCLR